MGCKFNSITLYSSAPEELVSFLVHIFDVQLQEESFYLLNDFKISISPSETVISSENFPHRFEIEVDSQDELQDFYQKACFYYYLQNKDEKKLEMESDKNKTLVITQSNTCFFDLCDPDGRVWRIFAQM